MRFLAALLAATRVVGALRIEAAARPGGLEEAQSRARAAIGARPTEDVQVVLQPGQHTLSAPLSFGPEDSGEPGRFRVVWSAAAPKTPRWTAASQCPAHGCSCRT